MPHFPKPFFRKSRKVWYVQLNGKQINLGPSRDEAFRHYRDLMASPKHSPLPPAPIVRVVELADLFLDWVRANRSAATFEWYRLRLQQFFNKYPHLSLAELRPFHVEQWAREAGGSPTTRRNRIRSIKRCVRWAKRQGHIQSDPIEALDVPSAQHKETYVSPEEFAQLLSYVRDERFADLLVVTYATGCRPQESLRVEARHVDLENSRWIFPRSESKGRAMPRIVYLNDEMLQICRRLVVAHPFGPLFRNRSGRLGQKIR